ncbi:MAG TPA: FecR domain-containing protein [Polyangia bacterium]|jgi:transmembrane sensor
MSEGDKPVGELRVRLDWTPEREAEVFRRLTRARKRQATTRTAGLAMGVFCLVAFAVGGVVAISRNRAASPGAAAEAAGDDEDTPAVPGELTGAVPARGPRERRLRFRDGSLAVLQSPDTVLEVLSVEDNRIVNELRSGSARFEITKRPTRVFRVIGGDTSVEVLGTKFEVERLDRRLRVSVTEGRVRVAWPGGERRLGKDETGIFPPAPAGAPDAASVSTSSPSLEQDGGSAGEAARRRTVRKRPVAVRELGARVQAHGQPLAEAKVESPPAELVATEPAGSAVSPAPKPTPAQASPARAEDRLSTMLRTADHARAGGRSLDAATALRAATAENPTDPRVPLAEFRLGRLLLEDMGKPAEAATAFARVRALAPAGPLAPDALAREIEARAASGDRATAHELSLEYLARYPTGSHAAWVRRWGALD